jgi:tetratricopeptide (TPR) repeat protein
MLLILLAVRTVQRNSDWQDPGMLWIKTVQTSPNSTKAHHSLGSIYFGQKEYGLAVEQYRIAESIYARNSELLSAFGTALHQMGNLEDAIRYYRRAIELAPRYPMIRFGLAGALRARGDTAEAEAQEQAIIEFYDDLIRKDPSGADHHYFKANALFHLGRLEQALAEYGRTLQIDPSYRGARESIDLVTRKLSGVNR